jgi:hypothetical protein
MGAKNGVIYASLRGSRKPVNHGLMSALIAEWIDAMIGFSSHDELDRILR